MSHNLAPDQIYKLCGDIVYNAKSMMDRINRENTNAKDMNQITHEIIDIIERDTAKREQTLQSRYQASQTPR